MVISEDEYRKGIEDIQCNIIGRLLQRGDALMIEGKDSSSVGNIIFQDDSYRKRILPHLSPIDS